MAAAALSGVAVWREGNWRTSSSRPARPSNGWTRSAALAAPDLRTVHGRAANGALVTVVASDRRNMAVVATANLPAFGSGKTYQLWLDHDGTMRPASLIDRDGTLVLTSDPADAGAVGLTSNPLANLLSPPPSLVS
ncbi:MULTISPECIES: anti-sigma factor [unclassified Streptomyces]|uniref:anti-sigma factor n=1 Tax=unclassified Streptomyces TaxID=2593676 RepID=UPI00364F0DA4